jgi:hypothetical protein
MALSALFLRVCQGPMGSGLRRTCCNTGGGYARPLASFSPGEPVTIFGAAQNHFLRLPLQLSSGTLSPIDRGLFSLRHAPFPVDFRARCRVCRRFACGGFAKFSQPASERSAFIRSIDERGIRRICTGLDRCRTLLQA